MPVLAGKRRDSIRATTESEKEPLSHRKDPLARTEHVVNLSALQQLDRSLVDRSLENPTFAAAPFASPGAGVRSALRPESSHGMRAESMDRSSIASPMPGNNKDGAEEEARGSKGKKS